MALDHAHRGYVLETGTHRARRQRRRAEDERAGAQDLPRRDVTGETVFPPSGHLLLVAGCPPPRCFVVWPVGLTAPWWRHGRSPYLRPLAPRRAEADTCAGRVVVAGAADRRGAVIRHSPEGPVRSLTRRLCRTSAGAWHRPGHPARPPRLPLNRSSRKAPGREFPLSAHARGASDGAWHRRRWTAASARRRRRAGRTAARAGSRRAVRRGRGPSRARRRGRAPGRSRAAAPRARRGSRRSAPHRADARRRRTRSTRRTAAADGRPVPAR